MENTDHEVEATQSTASGPIAVPEPVPLKPIGMAVSLAICSVGWLAPGLSHMLLGRWIRGVILAACVLGMFWLGISMQGKLYDISFQEPLHIFAFIANIGIGLPYLLAENWDMGIGTMTSRTYDYGTTFLWVSGLLNYLIVLDAFDIAQGRKP